MSDQRGKQWRGCREPYGSRGTVCSLVGKAPGDGKKVAAPRSRNTPNPPPFSP